VFCVDIKALEVELLGVEGRKNIMLNEYILVEEYMLVA
jgi:hypothetical protein